MPTTWIISELYYPEETSTGHFMTGIAEALATAGDVAVICAQPTYSRRGLMAPKAEIRKGVQIVRCRSTRFDKNHWMLKILNAVTAALSLFVTAVTSIRSGDRVIVVTNPPLLPYLIAVAARLRGVAYCLKVDDTYPEVLIAAGVFRPESLLVELWRAASRRLYRGAEHILVLGRDMAALIAKTSGSTDRIHVITNWADNNEIAPLPKRCTRLATENGLADKFVVQCAGNLGPLQGLDCLLRAAGELANCANVHFTILGSGREEKALRSRAAVLQLRNVTFLGQRSRNQQSDFLNACDVAVVSLVRGMVGISVPSRAYNVMAAGRPIIAVMEEGCEVAEMVREHQIGWVVPPGDEFRLAAAIREAEQAPERLAEMGRRARLLAETLFSRRSVLQAYVLASAAPIGGSHAEAVFAGAPPERLA